MKYVFYTNTLSPHQVPWCREFIRLVGYENFIYVTINTQCLEREQLGWRVDNINFSICAADDARDWLEKTEILLSTIRDVDLFDRRLKKGLITVYVAERWFKPPWGMLRLLHPQYYLMAAKFAALVKTQIVSMKDREADVSRPLFFLLPIGIYAAQDLARLIGLFSGNVKYLVRVPHVEMITKKPLSGFQLRAHKKGKQTNEASKYGLNNMRLWGYFVEPLMSASNDPASTHHHDCELGVHAKTPFRILWVGRMLEWKRVDVLVKAVVRLLEDGENIYLRIVGKGPEEEKLKQLAGNWLLSNRNPALENGQKNSSTRLHIMSLRGIDFSPPVAISMVRNLMRESEIYVMPSNGGEGWGAVINEGMTEGCCVLGTHEAGASATMIEDGHNGLLFHAGNVDELVSKIRQCYDMAFRRSVAANGQKTVQNRWSPMKGAEALFRFIESKYYS